MTVLVIGSGPAGAFAALGALQAGAKVLMIDAGLQLEPDAQRFRKTLGAVNWKELSPAERAAYKSSYEVFKTSLSNKRVFGSDFSTRPINTDKIKQKNCDITQSYALAGLSNVWGRGVEPPYRGEWEHWSFKEEFIQSLQMVLSKIPFSAEADNLAEVMPLYSKQHAPHPITVNSQELLEKWNRHEKTLNEGGIHFGKTRLAMRQGTVEMHGCQLCTMCFYGCPYGAMFNSAEIIAQLSSEYSDFSYKSGLRVKTFASEPDGQIKLAMDSLQGGKEEYIKTKHLIIAAGPPQTTTIVMRSLELNQATIKNSDLIKIPFIKIFGKSPREEEFHSLSQLTLTISNRSVAKRAVVMHLFGKNPLITSTILASFPSRWRVILEKMLSPLLSRLYIGMCFLHSDDSEEIYVKDDGQSIEFTGSSKKKTFRVYLRLLWVLLKHINKTGLMPIPGVGGVSLPGGSVHIGASTPIDGASIMGTKSTGQLKAFESVYVADASSLPDIPAGSYTLSIMANAHRIGSIVGALKV